MRNGLNIDLFKTKRWYKNDLIHREDGPAVEYSSGTKYWCINGLLHREDGPAVEYADGSKMYFFKGKRINAKSDEYFKRLIKLEILW